MLNQKKHVSRKQNFGQTIPLIELEHPLKLSNKRTHV